MTWVRIRDVYNARYTVAFPSSVMTILLDVRPCNTDSWPDATYPGTSVQTFGLNYQYGGMPSIYVTVGDDVTITIDQSTFPQLTWTSDETGIDYAMRLVISIDIEGQTLIVGKLDESLVYTEMTGTTSGDWPSSGPGWSSGLWLNNLEHPEVNLYGDNELGQVALFPVAATSEQLEDLANTGPESASIGFHSVHIDFSDSSIEGDTGATFNAAWLGGTEGVHWLFFEGYELDAPPPAEAEPIVDLTPKTDTFRGGSTVIIHGVPRLFNSALDVSFKGQTLPVSWSATLSSGARAKSSGNGVKLSTSLASSSSARISTSEEYESFDVTLTVRPLLPDHSPSTPVDHVIFEYYINGTSYARVAVRRVKEIGDKKALVTSTAGLADQTFAGGAKVFEAAEELKLRIVRHKNYVFLCVNDFDLLSTNRFVDSGVGTFRVTAANNSEAKKVSVLVSGLTVRSNALINGRLLRNKIDVAERRMEGLVPSAPIEELGEHSIVIFGPWGHRTLDTTFKYTVPEGVTLRRSTSDTLKAYSDPKVYDD